MSNSKITDLITKDKYQKEQEFHDDLNKVVNDYSGIIGVAAAIGILDIIKDEIKDAKRKEKD